MVNTNFTDLAGVHSFYGLVAPVSGGADMYESPTTCASSPCTVSPFTGICSAVSADSNLGVVCHREWNCANPELLGSFGSEDCAMGDEVSLSGDLAVTGLETVYSTLTAASEKRHFKITSGAHTECTFTENEATVGSDGAKQGHQIMTFKYYSSQIPSIAIVNTNFTDVAGSFPFYGFVSDGNTNPHGAAKYVSPTTCASSPCTISPFTGTCSAVSADSNLGVVCHREWNCANPELLGSFGRREDCVVTSQIVVSGSLNITGIPDANGVLPKIIGGGSNRLFKVENGGELVVRNLNLTGGDRTKRGSIVSVGGNSTLIIIETVVEEISDGIFTNASAWTFLLADYTTANPYPQTIAVADALRENILGAKPKSRVSGYLTHLALLGRSGAQTQSVEIAQMENIHMGEPCRARIIWSIAQLACLWHTPED
eukprot:g1717.t1